MNLDKSASVGFETRPLARRIGLEIRVFDARTATDQDILALAALLLAHVVLVIREQHLSSREHVAFASRFGQLEMFPSRAKDAEDRPWERHLFPVASHRAYGHTGVGMDWHTDGYFYEHPTAVSIMRPVRLPEAGGATYYANMGAIYESLPDQLRHIVQHLIATSNPVPANARSAGFGKVCATGARHRIVRPHPLTKRPVLFLNPRNIASIDGLTVDQAAHLIATLVERIDLGDFAYRHEWQPGDVVMWDNAGGAHKATEPDIRFVRLMERATVVGDEYYDSEFWRAAARLCGTRA